MKEKRTIACYETDTAGHLKPFAFLNLVQEWANRDAVNQGFGYEQLIEKESIWVLSRLKAVFVRTPVWREEITASTWHKGTDGLFSYRDFLVSNADESEVLIRATSSWLIIHTATRRIQRPRVFFPATGKHYQSLQHALEEPCQKIATPENGLSLTETRKVRYADMDMNLHMNSAKYMEWAMDCASHSLPVPQTVTSFQINFNAEALFGQTLELYKADLDTKIRYVEGRHENRNIFQVLITF